VTTAPITAPTVAQAARQLCPEDLTPACPKRPCPYCGGLVGSALVRIEAGEANGTLLVWFCSNRVGKNSTCNFHSVGL
jgi:hypothetical protein